ncbi:hypothetical protein J1N35_007412 [Gossypium stocksii]|uniref:Uncharacterized protein n=1 Tax=Gossypium stocksii TaxID=47602 RepID=A0A9D3W6F3_9ROSI|nr:hypothetical protein J1N35_007412 [Gossypium stocksii]
MPVSSMKNCLFFVSFMENLDMERASILSELELSFYPVRTRVDPLKIVFGWDLSLRAAARRCTPPVSRWLRETDRLESFLIKKEKDLSGKKLGSLKDSRSNFRDDLVQFYPNPNLIPLGSGQLASFKGLSRWNNMVTHAINKTTNGHELMEL